MMEYGLDRERCEEELSQKTQIHHGGYYGPWGRSGSGLSSPSMSRVTSPIRTGIPSTPTTPVLTTTTPSAQMLHHTTPTHHIFGPLQSSGYLVYSYGPGMVAGPGPVYTSPTTTAVVTSPVCYQPSANSPVGYGWQTSIANGFRTSGVQPSPRHSQGGCSRQDTPCCSHEASKSRSSTPVMPNSAPVVPNSFDPFSGYENRDPQERRRSAETRCEGRREFFYNVSEMEQQFERLSTSPHHSPTPPVNNIMDSPSSPTAATTTTISTTSSSCLNPSNINGSSRSRPPPALVQEQIARKQKLEVELAKQEEEKGRLQTEVEMMMRELSAKEQQRKLNADTNTMRIEEVQRENQRLQSECYEMENKILRLAPDMEPEGYPNLPRAQPFNEIPSAHQLTRGSSGSSLGSGTGTPQTPHTPHTPQLPAAYIPPRSVGLPPPIPPTTVPSLSYREFQGVPGEAVDEIGRKWGCTKCTFINHPDMNKCEMCDYPRFTIGTQEYPDWAMV